VPLVCDGITVWSALALSGDVKPTDIVGVIGIGGLGHLAIQFARAMGYTVVAFNTSKDKAEEAKQLRAKYFVAMEEPKETDLSVKANQLLITTSRLPGWDLFVPILAPKSTIYPQSVIPLEGKLNIPYVMFLVKGHRIVYAAGGTIPAFRQMLDFAVLHNSTPIIEKFPLTQQGIEDSLKMLESRRMRHRGVLYADGRK
jgi:D-arabinose 1-dehydrogenase-like Zn-dependent alcohol dehydrogenase